MPIASVSKIAKICNVSLKKAEEYWDKAKEIVKKQYPEIPEDSSRFFSLVMGIVKKMVGKECTKKLGWKPRAEDLLKLITLEDNEL